ncbi:MAG: amidohydrolase family protein [Planctomycetota bacterium]|jgi:predicted TIM-barrel fold metal-dependent hydrolase
MSSYNILEKALAGKPLDDWFVLDCHGHLDYWRGSPTFEVSADEMIARMDRIGIDMLCINKWNCPDVVLGNNDVAAVIKKYPERFLGYAATNPSLGRDFNRDELKRCFDEFGFTGIKVHNGYDMLPMRDHVNTLEFRDGLEAVWEFADEYKCSVLCHGYLNPEVANKYKEAVFFHAHAGGEKLSGDIYKDCPNVYLDTANSLTMPGNIERQIEVAGIDKIIFGTDMPFADPAYRLGQVVARKIPDHDMEKILGLNMARILGIEVPEKYRK